MSKPTLLSIRQKTTVTSIQLAEVAGLSLGQAYTVEIGGFTDEMNTQKVLDAFEKLTGQKLHLSDIRINSTASIRMSSGQGQAS